MDNLRKEILLGYAFGLLNGLSMRQDVSEEVREICKKANKKYETYCKSGHNHLTKE